MGLVSMLSKWNQQESTDINVELIHFNERFAPNATHSVFLHYNELIPNAIQMYWYEKKRPVVQLGLPLQIWTSHDILSSCL